MVKLPKVITFESPNEVKFYMYVQITLHGIYSQSCGYSIILQIEIIASPMHIRGVGSCSELGVLYQI